MPRSLALVVLAPALLACGLSARGPEPAALHPAVEQARQRHLPGPHHRALDAFLGTWSTEWQIESGPHSPVETPRGTAVFTRDMEGRFVTGRYEGGPVMGRSFQGRLVLGYDVERSQYVAFWINSFETRIATYAGSAELRATGEVGSLVLTGQAPPHPGRLAGAQLRSVFRWEGSNQIVEDGYLVEPDGSERHALRVMYRRIR